MHKFQNEIENLLEHALAVRGIMMKMINSTDSTEIVLLNEKKNEAEFSLR
jgi:hypothetical protein